MVGGAGVSNPWKKVIYMYDTGCCKSPKLLQTDNEVSHFIFLLLLCFSLATRQSAARTCLFRLINMKKGRCAPPPSPASLYYCLQERLMKYGKAAKSPSLGF
jgi:hypothetical protein